MQEQGCRKGRFWHIVCGIAFTAAMFAIMPKIIEKGADFISRKLPADGDPYRDLDDDDWGPEIVRKDSLED